MTEPLLITTFDVAMTTQLLCSKLNIEAHRLATMSGIRPRTLNAIIDGKRRNPQYKTREAIYLLAVEHGILSGESK